MRITGKMMSNNYQRNLNKTLNSLQKVNNQLASGKEISKPSDNPCLATRIMDYDTEIARKEQYLRNIEDVESFLDITDTALGQLGEQMKRLKELSVQASSQTNAADELSIIAKEVEGVVQAMVDTLNTSYDDKYIFAGKQTTVKPFEFVKNADGSFEVKYHGDNEVTQLDISKGVTVDRNITGEAVLGNVNGRNLFETLNEVLVAMNSGDSNRIGTLIPDMDEHFDNSVQLRGKVGSIQSRMELASEKAKDEILNMTTLLSDKEDVDWAAKMIEYKSLETGYTASMQISSHVLQKTLLDFIR